MKQENFRVTPSMIGQSLECPGSFIEDKRWEVPDFMNIFPIDIRANVIYRMHAILNNIDITDREELVSIHADMKKWLESEAQERSPECVQFLALQLQLTHNTLH